VLQTGHQQFLKSSSRFQSLRNSGLQTVGLTQCNRVQEAVGRKPDWSSFQMRDLHYEFAHDTSHLLDTNTLFTELLKRTEIVVD
jgi:hypothetical protein